MSAPISGNVLEQVMLTLQNLLDADEQQAIAGLEVDGQDVYLRLRDTGPGCRQCKRTPKEIRLALEDLPAVEKAYVIIGAEPWDVTSARCDPTPM